MLTILHIVSTKADNFLDAILDAGTRCLSIREHGCQVRVFCLHIVYNLNLHILTGRNHHGGSSGGKEVLFRGSNTRSRIILVRNNSRVQTYCLLIAGLSTCRALLTVFQTVVDNDGCAALEVGSTIVIHP